MTHVMAIDQGTTSTRCILFDINGKIQKQSQMEHDQIYVSPGWCEHDPNTLLANTTTVVNNTLNEYTTIAAVGITNQRETTLVWNRLNGKPLCNAIVWHDTRTQSIVTRFTNKVPPQSFNGTASEYVMEKTGLPLATYFSAMKLIWILETFPDADWENMLFGTIDTWLIWNFTGGSKNESIHVTDVTNASRTLMMNLETQMWDEELCTWLGIPMHLLPKICASSTFFGKGSIESCIPNLPISGVLGDQQAALFGQVCFEKGEAKNTYGTGCFLLLHTGSKAVRSTSGLLSTVAYKIGTEPTQFALEGSVAVAGAAIQWLRDQLQIIDDADHVEALAKQVEDNGGVYFVPAFTGLFAPHWKPEARGVLVGLTAYATKCHIARSALEAVAFQAADVVHAMEKDMGMKMKSLKVDGGMVGNELLMQFQSDLLNISLLRPVVSETTCLGAAYAAGLAVGFWSSTEELKSKWQGDKTWTPEMEPSVRNKYVRQWNKAVLRSLDWVEEEE